ncbi:30S ribosomal protein S3 [Candidatus Shapirobacteria bacterium CG03_land_8_20_14_0_80_40_19]|uniref:Small ribosomal subunit protein uS3 n=4 Tax=Candidatus Shapironibacteriota TaxID=1752721 RepID=A0A2M7BDZ2_9BACT|nr:MAG: 30S ribosomal protein S3 [Candidatus Shapirobacteria bacterium CG03_land_8_20_14_0_80_40_19]PJC29197.1 MAG: 30S ribosomal protein S3 [Candidatus Shapirobacteria bacterium CG_4_9_14_0_2_um_filter_40_11]PJC76656.1 MAG: 30S ribosomal protein S3 [Candidatus Shapirobacteria bacterium CG_4_8_14_3_um_filter_39_11]
MGQKINPIIFRIGSKYSWSSIWFADHKAFKKTLLEDIALRKFLMDRLKLAGIIGVKIERSINKIKITPQVTRPGVVIGRGGSGLEELKKQLCKMVFLPDPEKNLEISPQEIKNPDISAYFVAQKISEQIAKRMPYRQAVRRARERTMTAGAKGIKIALSGRIAGAEIARTQKYTNGSIPLQTLRAKIDFADVPSLTRSGYVGVKVWINQGEKDVIA